MFSILALLGMGAMALGMTVGNEGGGDAPGQAGTPATGATPDTGVAPAAGAQPATPAEPEMFEIKVDGRPMRVTRDEALGYASAGVHLSQEKHKMNQERQQLLETLGRAGIVMGQDGQFYRTDQPQPAKTDQTGLPENDPYVQHFNKMLKEAVAPIQQGFTSLQEREQHAQYQQAAQSRGSELDRTVSDTISSVLKPLNLDGGKNPVHKEAMQMFKELLDSALQADFAAGRLIDARTLQWNGDLREIVAFKARQLMPRIQTILNIPQQAVQSYVTGKQEKNANLPTQVSGNPPASGAKKFKSIRELNRALEDGSYKPD